MGRKADDRYIAFLCHRCHADLDQGSWMTKEQRQLLWETAHRKTVAILIGMGLVDADDSCAGQAGAEGQTSIRPGSDVHTEDDEEL